MSRKTRTDFQESFRIVLVDSEGRKTYKGPYQTKGAAKGQLTQEIDGWYGSEGKTGWLEKTTGWEKVEAA